MVKSSELEIGQVIEMRSGNIGHIIDGSQKSPLPFGMLWARLSGPTKNRVDLPVFIHDIVSVRDKQGNSVVVEHTLNEISLKRRLTSG